LTKVHLEECCAAVQPLATQTSLIAVLFADPNPDLTLLPMVANAGFAGVMLDTANKDGGGLMSHGSYAFLAQFVSNAQKLDLDAGLAGSLKLEDLAPLLRLSPDYLGFRGALCETGRASTIDGEKVERLANAMRDARELGDRTTV
ncbi:MAG: (5-formylfuran-3-yl)methyl phosphate synthase, partial [Burkholderiales bacterium]